MNFNWFRSKNRLSLVLIFTALLWFGTLSLRASDRYVATNGTDTGDFLTWATASSNIQWAVDKALSANDTVWVSNGTFVLTNQIVVTNQITLRSANGPDVTIVNGGFVADAAGATTNNRCLFLSNLSARVSGFTFSNGAVCSTGGAGAWIGGGILSNCTVRDNTAFTLTNASAAVYGAGLYINPRGTAMACRITGNIMTNGTSALSPAGAGIYGRGGAYPYYPDWEIYGCVVSNNRIVGAPLATQNRSGGGIYAINGKIISSLICNNSAATNGYGGGIYSVYGAYLSSSTVSVNEAVLGGAIYLASGIITNCLFSANYGSAGAIDGVYLSPNTPIYPAEIYNSTITGHTNTAFRMSAYEAAYSLTNKMINCVVENNNGLGVYLTGVTTNYSIIIISNCVVRNNKMGGINCTSVRNVQVRNCLIVNNTNNGNFAGMQIGTSGRTGTISVSSCTIASNYGTNYGAGIIFADTNGGITVSSCVIASNGVGGTNDVYDMYPPTNYNALQYSCVGTNAGFTGAGIIVTNPQFANFAGGNFRLSGNSPCVNRGSNETWMTNAVDLDGRARIRYGTVDMGAYEAIRAGTIYHFR